MGSTPDSDLYQTDVYKDPLLYSLYKRTNDSSANEIQNRHDWLLSLYNEKLNGEIIDEIEELNTQEIKSITKEILFNIRTHGWCVVRFYEEDTYKVFSSLDFSDWITEFDTDKNKKILKGIKVKWTDFLGNTLEDDLVFDESGVYLFTWEMGNGRPLPNSPDLTKWVIPDVTTPILGLSIRCRQLLESLTVVSKDPNFFHIVYGEGLDDAARNNLKSQMRYFGTEMAVGAKRDTIEEITVVQRGGVESTINALINEIGYFAAASRLPLSYYLGERQNSGFGDTGESTSELQIMKKKDSIIMHIQNELKDLLATEFGQPLPDLSNYFTKQYQEDKKAKEQLLLKSKENQENEGSEKDEKGTEGTDKE